MDAFAALIPGEALLAHCRNKHVTEGYETLFAEPQTRAWLAEIAATGGPVGYAMVTSPEFPEGLVQAGDLELRRIYLLSRFHGSGAGRQMMDAAIAHARGQGASGLLLGVHPENQRALAFYRRHGFRVVGGRRFQVGSAVFEDPVLRLAL